VTTRAFRQPRAVLHSDRYGRLTRINPFRTLWPETARRCRSRQIRATSGDRARGRWALRCIARRQSDRSRHRSISWDTAVGAAAARVRCAVTRCGARSAAM